MFLHNAKKKMLQVADRLFVQPISPMAQMIQWTAIRYLYLLLALLVLKGQWYVGAGSYGIDFVFWKEFPALVGFLAVTLLHAHFEPKQYFVKITVHTLYVLYFIPLNCAFSLNNCSFGFFLLSSLYFALLILAVFFLSRFLEDKLNNLRPSHLSQKKSLSGDKMIALFCLVLCCIFILYKLCYNGLSFSVSMDSEDVYGNRAEYQSFLDSISGTFLSYLITLIRHPINYLAPFYLLVCLLRKRYVGAGISLLTIFASYAISASKSSLLFIPIVLAVWLLYRLKLHRHFNRIFDLGILALLVLCVSEHLLLKSDRFYTLILRRQMYLPAWLNTMYYEYFMENGPVWWSQNTFLLQNLLPDVYDLSPLTIISNEFFQGQVPSPNTGLFAEAVMHAGVLGVLIYPILLSIMLILSGKILKHHSAPVQLFLAAKLAINLSNVPITRTDFVLSYILFMAALLLLPFLSPLWTKALAFTAHIREELEAELREDNS